MTCSYLVAGFPLSSHFSKSDNCCFSYVCCHGNALHVVGVKVESVGRGQEVMLQEDQVCILNSQYYIYIILFYLLFYLDIILSSCTHSYMFGFRCFYFEKKFRAMLVLWSINGTSKIMLAHFHVYFELWVLEPSKEWRMIQIFFAVFAFFTILSCCDSCIYSSVVMFC